VTPATSAEHGNGGHREDYCQLGSGLTADIAPHRSPPCCSLPQLLFPGTGFGFEQHTNSVDTMILDCSFLPQKQSVGYGVSDEHVRT